MQSISNNSSHKIWTVTEAKARLSELLRLTHEKPQYIGTKKSYVLITQEMWQEINQPKEPMGRWLVNSMSGIDGLELPSRLESEREIPFQ